MWVDARLPLHWKAEMLMGKERESALWFRCLLLASRTCLGLPRRPCGFIIRLNKN